MINVGRAIELLQRYPKDAELVVLDDFGNAIQLDDSPFHPVLDWFKEEPTWMPVLRVPYAHAKPDGTIEKAVQVQAPGVPYLD